MIGFASRIVLSVPVLALTGGYVTRERLAPRWKEAISMTMRPGLRLKLNLVLLPVVLGTLGVFVWLDFRHEVAAVMAIHDYHAVGGESAAARPVPPATTPSAVARQALVIHSIHGGLTALAMIIATNLVVGALVLRPIRRIQHDMELMQRGHWRMPADRCEPDEMGRLLARFQTLGLAVDALVAQALHAERLATLAIVSKRIGAEIEPEVLRIGTAAARLHQVRIESVQQAAHEILEAAARIMAAKRGLDRCFEPATRGRVAVAGANASEGRAAQPIAAEERMPDPRPPA